LSNHVENCSGAPRVSRIAPTLQLLGKLLSDFVTRIQNIAFCQKNVIQSERT